MSTAWPTPRRLVVERIDVRVGIEPVLVAFAAAQGPAILESSRPGGKYGRFSIFASDPVEVLEIDRASGVCPFRFLGERLAVLPPIDGQAPVIPFMGGWIGFWAYEAGLQTERIGYRSETTPGAPGPLPLARFGLYDHAVVYDHGEEQWYGTAVEWPASVAARRPTAAQRLDALRARVRAAADKTRSDACAAPTTEPLTPGIERSDYLTAVERVQRYIEAGDVYQVNLTQRFTTRTSASPVALYRRLRRMNPSSHAALLLWDDIAVLSSSPELFLDVRRGHVVTRPIKGTRPRVGVPRIDAAYRRELATSEKERAELNMIVDLLRNDLGRVCSFGSVRVTEPGEIEEHPTVFHRVATIEGDLAPGGSLIDLLRATFPGGSVTGAPKIRAMQISHELEPTPRGVYCGSIGWIGLDGAMSFNLAIRTIVQRGDRVSLYAGGAIVADSTPETEYDETITKLTGMLRALNCDPPSGSLTAEVAELAAT